MVESVYKERIKLYKTSRKTVYKVKGNTSSLLPMKGTHSV